MYVVFQRQRTGETPERKVPPGFLSGTGGRSCRGYGNESLVDSARIFRSKSGVMRAVNAMRQYRPHCDYTIYEVELSVVDMKEDW